MAKQVLYRGTQWRATTKFVETLDGPGRNGSTYYIPTARLAEGLDTWGWPCQLADKGWVYLDDFISAFQAACDCFGIDPELVEAAIERARFNRANRGRRYQSGTTTHTVH